MTKEELRHIFELINKYWQIFKRYSDIKSDDEQRWSELSKELNDINEDDPDVREFCDSFGVACATLLHRKAVRNG